MNATTPFTGCGGSGRSAQVSPRSVERKSRVPATKAHRTVPLGADRSAKLGSGISVGVADGAGARVAVGAPVGVGLATARVAAGLGDAAGCDPQAVSAIANRTDRRRVTPARSPGRAPAPRHRGRPDP